MCTQDNAGLSLHDSQSEPIYSYGLPHSKQDRHMTVEYNRCHKMGSGVDCGLDYTDWITDSITGNRQHSGALAMTFT